MHTAAEYGVFVEHPTSDVVFTERYFISSCLSYPKVNCAQSFKSGKQALHHHNLDMDESLTVDEKIALINENLQEVLKPEIIDDVIRRQNRPLIIYWGISTRLLRNAIN